MALVSVRNKIMHSFYLSDQTFSTNKSRGVIIGQTTLGDYIFNGVGFNEGSDTIYNYFMIKSHF